MKKLFCDYFLCVALLLTATSGLAEQSGQPFSWPEGIRAAVNLAYDDALNSQLDNAVPALDRYGFKGSFYLVMASAPLQTRMEEWREIARNGHTERTYTATCGD